MGPRKPFHPPSWRTLATPHRGTASRRRPLLRNRSRPASGSLLVALKSNSVPAPQHILGRVPRGHPRFRTPLGDRALRRRTRTCIRADQPERSCCCGSCSPPRPREEQIIYGDSAAVNTCRGSKSITLRRDLCANPRSAGRVCGSALPHNWQGRAPDLTFGTRSGEHRRMGRAARAVAPGRRHREAGPSTEPADITVGPCQPGAGSSTRDAVLVQSCCPPASGEA